MKKISLLLILLISINLFSQTDGMSYQALILNPDLEMPGVNDNTNIYPNKNLGVVFTIFDSEGSIEYRETHNTSTDDYGMISLIIGFGYSDIGSYDNINWDGTSKDLLVDINLGDGFVELSNQPLLFTPYAYHRDIIATGNSTLLGTLDVGGDAVFASNLNVDGNSVLVGTLNTQGDTDLDSNLNVDGNSVLVGTLDVGGDAVFASDVIIEGDLITVGDELIDGDLNVLGDTDLGGSLDVDGDTSVLGDTDLGGSLDVDGDTHIYGNLIVEGETTLNDTLVVNSYVKIFNSSYTEDDASINDKLIVYGKSILGDTVIAMSDVKINKNLEVYEKSVFRDSVNASSHVLIDGNSVLVGTLNTQGDTDLDSNLNVDGNSVLVGTLNTQGDTDLDSNLNVDGNSVLVGTLNTQGDTDLDSNLNVDGTTTIGEDLNVTGDIYVSGDVITVGDDVVDGDMQIVGDAELESDLVVNGLTNLSNLVVNGISSMNDKLTVNADTQLNNNLNVEGNSSITGTLDVTSNTQLNGALSVVGTTQLTGNVHSLTSSQIDGNLSVGTDTSLQGDLNVQGNTSVQNLLVNGTLTTVGGIVDEGDLLVGGDEEVEGNLTIDSDLTVLHDTELKDSLIVHEFAQFNKDIKVMIDLNVDGNTNIVGSTTLGGNLNVSDETMTIQNGKLTLGKIDNLADAVSINGQTSINFNPSLISPAPASAPPVDFVSQIQSIANSTADAIIPIIENIIPNPNDGSAYADWYNERLESLYNASDTTSFALKVKTPQNGIVVIADVDVPNSEQSFIQFNNNAGRPYGSVRGYDPSLGDVYLKPDVILKNAITLYSIYKKAKKYVEVSSLLGECAFQEAVASGSGTLSSFAAEGGIVEGLGTGVGSITAGGGFGTGIGNGVGGGPIEGVAEVVGAAEGFGVAVVEAAGPVEGAAEVDVEVNTEVTITELTGEVETEVTITEGEVSIVIDELTTEVAIEIEDVQVSCTNTESLKLVFFLELETVIYKEALYNAITTPMNARPGVTYSSGFADYAEWIERENKYEIMYPGDIVAVNGGLITKNISDKHNQLLVISTNPAILGNIPEIHEQHLHEKVAFMGQIPVKVRGSVNRGDFIIYSELNDGSGIAISPEDIKADQYKKIVGVAWDSRYGNDIAYINMSIGLNSNSLTKLAENHDNRIAQLENNIRSIHQRVSKIENKNNIIPIENFNLSLNDKDLNNSISISNNSKYREIHPDTFENWKQLLVTSLENNLFDGKKKEAALLYLNDAKVQKAYKDRINKLYVDHMNEVHPHFHD